MDIFKEVIQQTSEYEVLLQKQPIKECCDSVHNGYWRTCCLPLAHIHSARTTRCR